MISKTSTFCKKNSMLFDVADCALEQYLTEITGWS